MLLTLETLLLLALKLLVLALELRLLEGLLLLRRLEGLLLLLLWWLNTSVRQNFRPQTHRALSWKWYSVRANNGLATYTEKICLAVKCIQRCGIAAAQHYHQLILAISLLQKIDVHARTILDHERSGSVSAWASTLALRHAICLCKDDWFVICGLIRGKAICACHHGDGQCGDGNQ
ncbi:MAG: hypothetical protein V7703_10580 [Hyphomicrobiales bacterium]